MTLCNLTLGTKVQDFQMVIAIPTFILGFLANSAVLVLFCRQWRNCSDMMVYLANIVLADSTALVSLPFRMYSYRKSWPFSRGSCQVLISTYFVNTYVSIFTTMAISVVRFVAIKFPFKARAVMSPLKALMVCVLTWVVPCSLSAVFHDVAANSTMRCFQKDSDRPLPLSFILVLDVVGFLLPLIVMTFCSVNVIRTLVKKDMSKNHPERKQSVRIIAANLAVFIVCFSPVHFGYMLKFLSETYWSHDCGRLQFAHSFVHVASSLASTNCFLDSFSYYFLATSSWGTLREACCGTQQRERQHSTVI
ncbi:hypothetical protein ACEWY4_014906 [Coilia grayii]|uniref:G-protein coupled receptors family 1 profile domain-containing protein n=1 Tax=Coilia grayii TaxID=363190 RepID=A0ABD1JTJ6_9TELE